VDSSAARRLAGLALLLAGLTAVVTYPQVLQLSTGVNDFGDPLLNAWALAWTAHVVPLHVPSIFDANIFYPAHGTLALSETLIFPALLVAPARWLGMNPIALHNVTLLLGYILSGLTMFVLVRHLTGEIPAALIAAVIFSLYPLRTEHFPRVQLQQTYLMPLALLQLHRIIDGAPGWKPAVLLGLAVAAQFASCVYYTVYFVTVLPLIALMLLVPAAGLKRRAVVQIAAAGIVALLFVALLLPPYLRNRHTVGQREARDLIAGSAEPRDYRRAHPQSLLYGRSHSIGPAERRLFPGFTVIGLAAASVAGPAALAVPYVAALAVSLDASLGVHGRVYPWLYEYVLPYRGLRVPARFAMLAGMFLSILAGLGSAAMLRRIRPPRMRVAFVWAAVLLVVGESLNRPLVLRQMDQSPPAVYEWLRAAPDGAVVEYPVDGLEGRAGPQDPTYMYYSTLHWKPLLNGYSGFAPPSYAELLDRMRDFPNAASIDYLRGRHAKYLLVHSAYYISGGFKEDVDRLRGLTGVRHLVSFASTARGTTEVFEILR
jgi:hypothetical protein